MGVLCVSHFHLIWTYLLMPLYGCVSTAPVFNRHFTAETADAIGVTGVVESSPGQSLCGHLLNQTGAVERVETVVHEGEVNQIIAL